MIGHGALWRLLHRNREFRTGSPTDQVDGLPRLNLWSPPPSSTDVSTSEVGREEVRQEQP